MEAKFIDRDISWLYFNERVLGEAKKESTPLLERMKFLAIYSSNLDEFFRVRIPMIYGKRKIIKKNKTKSQVEDSQPSTYKEIKQIIRRQQKLFGKILVKSILPKLREEGIILNYGNKIPEFAIPELRKHFQVNLASYIHIVDLKKVPDFFPLNNQIYFYCTTKEENAYIIKIPSENASRFKVIHHDGYDYVFFIDDIIKHFIQENDLFKNLSQIYSFKVTREAELNIKEEAGKDLSEELRKELKKRDFGLATRLLYPFNLPESELQNALEYLNLKKSNTMKGGLYHNLKDFFSFPIDNQDLQFEPFKPVSQLDSSHFEMPNIFDVLDHEDILLHTPYHDYDLVLRFFNEAALDPNVSHIYTTVYRLAKDSKIGHALLNAARNGKKVFVFVELKARFDESNNILWAKRLKSEGVHISYGIPKIKVHAKVALVIKNNKYYGLLSTGNLNENTAKQYTDHSMLTSNQAILEELHQLFVFLSQNRRKTVDDNIEFKHLLVAHFNLYEEFLKLIDFEIKEAEAGRKGKIRIKLNNLEEESLIEKLYEASQKGVQIELIVRGICRLIPGIKGMSENIQIKRIVGRFLEHSRIFNFYHAGDDLVFLGSSDWMFRNVFNRVEVCFPINGKKQKKEILTYLQIQIDDDVNASLIGEDGKNVEIETIKGINSQIAIRDFLDEK